MFDPSKLPDLSKPRLRVEHDGYLAMFVPDSTLDGLQSFHFIVKRTFDFAPNEMLQTKTWQRQIFTSDQYFENGNPYEAAVRFESDLCPPKVGVDVLVNAICYPPGGEARQCYPEVKVGDHPVRRVAVIGDRVAWIKGGGTPVFSPAKKFSALPLRYEYAYGGVDRQHAMSPLMCGSNPIGTGYLMAPVQGEAPRDRWTPLPNIEWPDRLLTPDTLLVPMMGKQAELRAPAGFGPIPRHWEPRSLKAGMPGDAKPMWKLLFADQDKDGEHFREMQPSFWNAAPEGMVFPQLEGHEKITLRHMHRQWEDLVIRLPIMQPSLRVAINDNAMEAVAVTLDTVQVEVEAGEVMLTWRGTVPRPDDLDALDKLTGVLMEIDGELVLPAPLLGTGFPIALLKGDFPGPDVLKLKGVTRP
jgi:hypothetical protein